ncbi:MAG: helix-turn-helix transcriptional regulator [Actinobacteria bacterium]|nr:helix-turn-helix transcriptional regulator [Actinomycetota bacterium]
MPTNGRGEDPPIGTIDPERGFPAPGEVLKRLRTQRGWTLRDVADRSGLSSSFLGSVERGESDIALERLSRLAAVFDHDIGSFLGYSARQSRPAFLGEDERLSVDRGEGIAYEVIRAPGLGFEIVRVRLDPKAAFDNDLAHEGVDVTLVVSGTVTARYNGVDYELERGTCVMWSGGYPHSFRNDTSEPAEYIGVVTAMVY